jgi:hypothetical protein
VVLTQVRWLAVASSSTDPASPRPMTRSPQPSGSVPPHLDIPPCRREGGWNQNLADEFETALRNARTRRVTR